MLSFVAQTVWQRWMELMLKNQIDGPLIILGHYKALGRSSFFFFVRIPVIKKRHLDVKASNSIV